MGKQFKLELFEPSKRGHQGKTLEGLIERTVSSEFLVVRIPDAHAYGGHRARMRVPCDYIGSVRGLPLALEAKESEEEQIPYSVLLKRPHQYDFLSRWINAHPHHVAGFVLLTRERFLTWLPASELTPHTSYGPHLWGCGGFRGLDLLKDPLDWATLILGGESGTTESTRNS